MKPSDDDINDLLVCEELREVAEHIEQMTDEERADCLHDLNREWDAHFNDLCKEYGEEQYCISYEHPDEYYYNITPEDKLYCMHLDRWGRETKKLIDAFAKEHNLEEQN